MSNKFQIYYTPNNKCHISKAIKMPNRWSLSECQLKYTGKGVNLNTNGQIIIKGNPTLPEQSVNAFIEEKQYEITVHMSSNFYYRNADENINVRNSKGTTVSHSHFRSRREGEPHSMVTRLFNRKKKKNRKIQWNYTLRNVSQTHLYWRLCCGDIIIIIPLSNTKVKLHVFPKELFHYAKFVHYLNQDTKA